ncbi:hypothetical protein [Leucobacter sp. W1478]|uniref:hypothetical protein n=1 Tax=Leucobacter sp. W1478 TaxID=3439065 RepID=UPI003F2AF231
MTSSWKWTLAIGGSTVLILVVLVWLSIRLGSDWSTFIPDLIIGVVGAAVIGLVLMAVQHSSDRRRAHTTDVTAAYNRLLDALTPLRTLDLATGDASQVSVMRTQLVQLFETVDVKEDRTAFGEWLNAEGQLCLFRATQALEALRKVADRSDLDAILEASSPFHRWVAEFSHNIRFWRTGNVSEATIREQAGAIESILRKEGVWREDNMPWRNHL